MRLYVGNLSFQTTEEELKELFETVGTVVEAQLVMDRMMNRPRGFGFVTMSTDDEGQRAIERFNDYEWGGRKLTVNEARPLTERPPRREFRGGGGGGRGGRGGDRGDRGDRRGTYGGGYDER